MTTNNLLADITKLAVQNTLGIDKHALIKSYSVLLPLMSRSPLFAKAGILGSELLKDKKKFQGIINYVQKVKKILSKYSVDSYGKLDASKVDDSDFLEMNPRRLPDVKKFLSEVDIFASDYYSGSDFRKLREIFDLYAFYSKAPEYEKSNRKTSILSKLQAERTSDKLTPQAIVTKGLERSTNGSLGLNQMFSDYVNDTKLAPADITHIAKTCIKDTTFETFISLFKYGKTSKFKADNLKKIIKEIEKSVGAKLVAVFADKSPRTNSVEYDTYEDGSDAKPEISSWTKEGNFVYIPIHFKDICSNSMPEVDNLTVYLPNSVYFYFRAIKYFNGDERERERINKIFDTPSNIIKAYQTLQTYLPELDKQEDAMTNEVNREVQSLKSFIIVHSTLLKEALTYIKNEKSKNAYEYKEILTTFKQLIPMPKNSTGGRRFTKNAFSAYEDKKLPLGYFLK